MAEEAHEQEAAGTAQEPREPAGAPVGGTGGTEATEGGTAQEGALSPNREAAKRRRQLREVEAERDTLRSRLDSYDRAEVERLAADRLADPGDLWLSTSIEALRGDDGALDAEKVTAELDKITTDAPTGASSRRGPRFTRARGERSRRRRPSARPSSTHLGAAQRPRANAPFRVNRRRVLASPRTAGPTPIV